jgi:hypothetical protein
MYPEGHQPNHKRKEQKNCSGTKQVPHQNDQDSQMGLLFLPVKGIIGHG